MSVLKRLKPYKARPPAETIDYIKGIARDNGMSVREIDNSEPERIFFAYNLELMPAGSEKVCFRCNGKGMTREYALASAYGELLERVQNQVLYMGTVYYSEPEIPEIKDVDGPFRYAPDAKVIPVAELVEGSFEEMEGLLNLQSADKAEQLDYIRNVLGYDELTCVPFYAPFERKLKWLPSRAMYLIVLSNGMCSGNTKKEAVIQGICEVFERLVQKRLYISPFTPPTIPDSYFEGTEIMERIAAVEDRWGVKVIVKDCSMGMGLPVIGVLLLDEQRKRYHFHLGSDPSPITALERCLVETFQGGNIRFMPLLDHRAGADPVQDEAFLKDEFFKATVDGSGHYPREIFSADESYSFTGFNHPVTESDDEDLAYLMGILSRNGHRLLVRDVSFLGQPAALVYVPGAGEIHNAFGNAEVAARLRFDRKIGLLLRIPDLSDEQVAELAEALERVKVTSDTGPIGFGRYFRHVPTNPICEIRDDYLLFLLYLCAGNYSKANRWLDAMMDDPRKPRFNASLYAFLKEYLKLRMAGRTQSECEPTLAEKFGPQAVEKCRPFLKACQADLPYPRCFDCEQCPFTSQCILHEVKGLLKTLNAKYMAFGYDQMANRELFEGAMPA